MTWGSGSSAHPSPLESGQHMRPNTVRRKHTINQRRAGAARSLHILVGTDMRLSFRELERLVRLPLERGIGVELLRLLLCSGDSGLRVVASMPMYVRFVL